MNNLILRKIIWGMTAAAMLFIFWLSSRPVEVSRQDSAWVMEKLNVAESKEEAADVNNSAMMRLNNFIRKQAHVVMYLGLAGLIYLSLYGYTGKSLKTGIAAWILTVIYAITDEIHQIFSARGASAGDVLIDARGAAIGVAIAVILFLLIEHSQAVFHFVNRFYNLEVGNDNGKKLRNHAKAYNLYDFRLKR